MPEAYAQLTDTLARMEAHYREMQDIEFTVEDGTLYLLQTRTGKRTAAAALRIAVEMVDEGLISREEAVARIDPGQLDQLLHPMIDPKAQIDVAAKGLNASPGAASGAIVLDADTAECRAELGEAVILVRVETSPEDIHGMHAAKGVLTARGGMTSHAAVVARGMGRPCVSGASGISIDMPSRTLLIGSRKLKEGDVITLDGATGDIMAGEVATIEPELVGDFGTLMAYVHEPYAADYRFTSALPAQILKALAPALQPLVRHPGCGAAGAAGTAAPGPSVRE